MDCHSCLLFFLIEYPWFWCLFVCSRVGSLLCLMNWIRICRVPGLLMRHEAIEMVCANLWFWYSNSPPPPSPTKAPSPTTAAPSPKPWWRLWNNLWNLWTGLQWISYIPHKLCCYSISRPFSAFKLIAFQDIFWDDRWPVLWKKHSDCHILNKQCISSTDL